MMSGFGIVGTGVIAALHAAAIRTLPGARLEPVTDVVAGAAGPSPPPAAARLEPDLDALLARPDVDVVCVCVLERPARRDRHPRRSAPGSTWRWRSRSMSPWPRPTG